MKTLISFIVITFLCQGLTLQGQQLVWQKQVTATPIQAIDVSPDGSLIAVKVDSTITILDGRNGDSLFAFRRDKIVEFVIGADNKKLFFIRRESQTVERVTLFSWTFGASAADSVTWIAAEIPGYFVSDFATLPHLTITITDDHKYVFLGGVRWTQPNAYPITCETFGRQVNTMTGQILDCWHTMLYSPSLRSQYWYNYTNGYSFGIHGIYYSGKRLEIRVSNVLGQSYLKNFLPVRSFIDSLRYCHTDQGIYNHRIDTLIKKLPLGRMISERFMTTIDSQGVVALRDIYRDSIAEVYNLVPVDSASDYRVCKLGTRIIVVFGKKVACFDISQNLLPMPLLVDFRATTYKTKVNNPISFLPLVYPIDGVQCHWDFGDGTGSDVEEINHSYTKSGTYIVTLSAKRSYGDTNTVSRKKTITVDVVSENIEWIKKDLDSLVSVTFTPDGTKIFSMMKNQFIPIRLTSNGDSIGARGFSQWNNPRRYNASLSFSGKSEDLYLLSYDVDWLGILTFYLGKIDSANKAYRVLGSKSMCTNDAICYLQSSYNNWVSSRFDLASTLFVIDEFFSASIGQSVFYVGSAFQKSDIYNNWHYFGNILRFPRDDTAGYTYETCKQCQYVKYFFQDTLLRSQISATLSPDKKLMVSSANWLFLKTPNPVSILGTDISTGLLKYSYPDSTHSLRFSPDNFHLLTRSGLWDLSQGKVVKPLSIDDSPQYCFFPDGIHVAVLFPTDSAAVRIFNIQMNSYEYSYGKFPNKATCMALSPDAKHIAVGCDNGNLLMLKVPSVQHVDSIDFEADYRYRTSATINDTIPFFNTSQPVDNTFAFTWDFGDGTSSIDRNPRHQYLSNGVYTVTLVAENSSVTIGTRTKTQYITVTDVNDVTELRSDFDISLVPNPAQQNFELQMSESSQPYVVTLYDALGCIVYSTHSLDTRVTVDVSKLPDAMYYCVVRRASTQRVLPLSVVH